MFTGIITAVGTLQSVEQRGDLRAEIACPFDPALIAIGASIACSGVCLTVVERGGEVGKAWFSVDISGETQACTVPGRWAVGTTLNLEPALKLGEELGGHIVIGHVDAVGRVTERHSDGDSIRIVIAAPKDMAPYLAPKGSITVDGVSLTVNSLEDQSDGSVHFGLNIIPHTAAVTTLAALQPGDGVNLEIDVLARYLQRMQSLRS
jgi:riboflavin synthase